MRLLVRSFVCCVLATGAHGQTNVTVVYPPQTPSVMVIESPAMRRADFQARLAPAGQVTYMIAFKDSVVRLAEQYWVSGNTLYYVTADHERLTAPLDRVDRVLSKRLNSERDVAFFLPPGQGKVVIRHTASLVHKRCNCVSAAAVSPRAKSGASRSVSR